MWKSFRRGFVLSELLVTIAIIATLAAVVIPAFLQARVSANNAVAQQRLKIIGTSLEHYIRDNGNYPDDITSLLNTSPPYLSTDFFTGTHGGFTYAVTSITPGGYEITATPTSGLNGSKTYHVTNNAVVEEVVPE